MSNKQVMETVKLNNINDVFATIATIINTKDSKKDSKKDNKKNDLDLSTKEKIGQAYQQKKISLDEMLKAIDKLNTPTTKTQITLDLTKRVLEEKTKLIEYMGCDIKQYNTISDTLQSPLTQYASVCILENRVKEHKAKLEKAIEKFSIGENGDATTIFTSLLLCLHQALQSNYTSQKAKSTELAIVNKEFVNMLQSHKLLEGRDELITKIMSYSDK